MGIFRRKDSPYWWYWLEGTTVTKSTKIQHSGRTPADSKRLEADALEVYRSQMGDLVRGIHKLPSRDQRGGRRFDDQLDWYLDHVSPTHNGHEREKDLAKPLRDHFATALLTAIDRPAAAEYATRRLATRKRVNLGHGRSRELEGTIAASTVNREISFLKQVMRSAVPKYIDASPLDGMRKLKEAPVRRRTMSPAEEKRLLAALATDDRALVLMALDCLVRMSDCLDVRRADVQGNELEIIDPKNGTSYRVPLSQRLKAALEAVPVYPFDKQHYFGRRRRAETEAGRRSAVRQMLHQACKRAGLDYGRAAGGLTFHWATRRTGLSRMLQSSKVSLPTAQKIGNWKRPDVVLTVYAETINAQERAAVEIVGQRPRKRA